MINGLQARADELGTARPAGRFRSRSTLDDGGTSDRIVARAVARAKEGDREAVRYLYLRYADNVYGYVREIVRDDYEAEDVTQHVFAKLMTAHPQVRAARRPVLRPGSCASPATSRSTTCARAARSPPTRSAAPTSAPTTSGERPRSRACATRSPRCPTSSATSSSCATSSASRRARSPTGSAAPSPRSTGCTTAAARALQTQLLDARWTLRAPQGGRLTWPHAYPAGSHDPAARRGSIGPAARARPRRPGAARGAARGRRPRRDAGRLHARRRARGVRARVRRLLGRDYTRRRLLRHRGARRSRCARWTSAPATR